MGDIAAYSRGLSNLVQAGDLGAGIRRALDELRFTLDVKDLLEINRRRSILFGGSIVAASVQQFIVPLGEIWRVRYFGASVTTGVGVTCQGTRLEIQYPGAGAAAAIGPVTPGLDLAASQEGAMIAECLVGEILLPGTILLMRGGVVTGIPSALGVLTYDLIATAS